MYTFYLYIVIQLPSRSAVAKSRKTEAHPYQIPNNLDILPKQSGSGSEVVCCSFISGLV